jgi:hypothetical protein
MSSLLARFLMILSINGGLISFGGQVGGNGDEDMLVFGRFCRGVDDWITRVIGIFLIDLINFYYFMSIP